MKASRSLWGALLKVVALGLLGCTGSAIAAGPAVFRPAPERHIRIELTAGPLQQAVEQLAELAGLQILYDPDLLRGQTTRGLHANLTPEQALEQLLAGRNSSVGAG